MAWPGQPANVFGEIWSVARTGGTPKLLAQGPRSFQYVGMTMAPNDDLFWGDDDPAGEATTGNGATIIAHKWSRAAGEMVLGKTGIEHVTNPPFGRIAADARAVYFTAGAGRIFKANSCCVPQ